MTHSQVSSELHHIVSSAFQSVSATAGTGLCLGGMRAAPPDDAGRADGCHGTAPAALVHLGDARWLGCGVLAGLWGAGRAVWHLPHCSAAVGHSSSPGQASCARVADALAAGTVPVALAARPWWCSQCQHCPGDRSCVKLMIDPGVTPRPPGAAGKSPSHARDRGWDWPHPNGVPAGLPGKLRPRRAVGGSLCRASPGHRAHLRHGDARCRTKERVGCCWGAAWSPAGLGSRGHGQRGLEGLGDQRGHGHGGRDVSGVWDAGAGRGLMPPLPSRGSLCVPG